jgi:hypothetical protein
LLFALKLFFRSLFGFLKLHAFLQLGGALASVFTNMPAGDYGTKL